MQLSSTRIVHGLDLFVCFTEPPAGSVFSPHWYKFRREITLESRDRRPVEEQRSRTTISIRIRVKQKRRRLSIPIGMRQAFYSYGMERIWRCLHDELWWPADGQVNVFNFPRQIWYAEGYQTWVVWVASPNKEPGIGSGVHIWSLTISGIERINGTFC